MKCIVVLETSTYVSYFKRKEKVKTAKKSGVSAISSQKENERFAKMADEKAQIIMRRFLLVFKECLMNSEVLEGLQKQEPETFGKTTIVVRSKRKLSIDQQMRSLETIINVSEEKAANKKAMGDVKKVAPKRYQN